MLKLPKDKKIILFDGVCNLCNIAVQTIIKHDKNDAFRFVALQSDLGITIQKHIGIDSQKIDSIIFYAPNVSYSYKANAIFDIANTLGGIYKMALIFRIIPAKVLNVLYDYIAKNRYKWYGMKENCLLPTPEIMSKLL